MKVFIDTNVILDAVISRKPFNTIAEQIFLLTAKELLAVDFISRFFQKDR